MHSGYVDPWGELYKIKFDDNYDNRIQGVGTNNSAPERQKKVAVWNDPSTHSDSASHGQEEQALRDLLGIVFPSRV